MYPELDVGAPVLLLLRPLHIDGQDQSGKVHNIFCVRNSHIVTESRVRLQGERYPIDRGPG